MSEFHIYNLGNLPLIIFKTNVGYIATPYISKEMAEKVGDIAAFTDGVKTKEAFVKGKIRKITKWAEDLGLREGMTVKRAMRILEEAETKST